jgi:hypothetical protein
LSFVALVILQASVIDLLLLEVFASYMTWRSGNREPFKKIMNVAGVIVRGVVLASRKR